MGAQGALDVFWSEFAVIDALFHAVLQTGLAVLNFCSGYPRFNSGWGEASTEIVSGLPRFLWRMLRPYVLYVNNQYRIDPPESGKSKSIIIGLP
jgi:hypothetical protein